MIFKSIRSTDHSNGSIAKPMLKILGSLHYIHNHNDE